MQLQYYPPNVTKPSSCGSSRQGVAAPDGEQASSDLQGDEMGNTRVEKQQRRKIVRQRNGGWCWGAIKPTVVEKTARGA